ncbi:hypothetical protein PCANC_18354 [Puccinia coronata f. sp. avenae]|uniref:Uncharacterized protein n=1 Tax=Puccinia coronata f. sp. avenae TaxID=200324 RepID=A0A2N5SN77_9BASI|nr:hypothetical protein PCANC_18354 [Puccinia coronata f. sp. avenae]
MEPATTNNDQRRICRFQTTPPIPFIKVVMSISDEWTIERLTTSIHQMVMHEIEPEEAKHLLEGLLATSHKLLLELNDGCRLPTTELCNIIQKDQLVNIRLSPKVQQRAPSILPANILTSIQPANPNLSNYHHWPRTNNSNDQPFHSHDPFNLLSSNRNLFTFNSPEHYTSPTPEINPNQNHSRRNYLYSSHQITHQQHQPSAEPQTIIQDSIHQPLFGTSNRLTSLPPNISNHHHPLQDQDQTTHQDYHHHHTSPIPEIDPRLQTTDTPHHTSTEQSFSVAFEEQQSTFPYRRDSTTSSTEEPKPTTEELNQSIANASDRDVARVRSHIAGFRESATRHYCQSDADSSFNRDQSLHSSDESDESDDNNFSVHARHCNKKFGSRRSNHQPTKFSTRRSTGEHTNRRGDSSRPKRKSAPVRFASDPCDHNQDERESSTNENLTRRHKGNKRDKIRGHQSTHSHNRSSSTSARHQTQTSPVTLPRKYHPLQRVQVVIPPSSGLVSPAQLKRRRTQLEAPKVSPPTSAIHPAPSSQSVDNTSSSARPQNASNQSAQQDRSSNLAKSCSPLKSISSDNKPRSVTKSCSPDKSNLSLSTGRSVRAVYEIHVHDVKFKSASGQGPQRIPCSSSGLNDRSTLAQVVERLKLDMQTSWKLIVDDKVWLSRASTLKRSPNRANSTRPGGLLDGRIVRDDWTVTLKQLGIFPLSNTPSDTKPLQIQVIRNWDLK